MQPVVGSGMPGGQMGGGPQGQQNMQANKAVEENNLRNQYSIPGILHFIQHEWSRFEMERSQWEVEKAELQARIAFLQGERKGQENLKNDLVRRIKMLEYALKQERAKYAKLKYGGEGGDVGPPPQDEDGMELPALEQADNMIAVTNSNWRQGRQLLRQYLQEIGYTDTIIDVRSNRVRSLLGLQADTENETNQNLANGAETTRRVPDNRRRWDGPNKAQTGGTGANMAEEMLINTEESVMANFDFLAREDDLDDEDEVMAEETDDGFNPSQIVKKADLGSLGVDSDTEDVLKEFNFLTQSSGQNEPDVVDKGAEWSGGGEWGVGPVGTGGQVAGPQPVDQTNLELGELEQLTINNDNDMNYDQITTPKEAFRKTWSAKYTLRSHFDGVRSLAFHPSEPVLITASEDQTLKMWNLQKTITTKKSTNLDVEPVYTFRGHTGPVLCLTVSGVGDFCFSGGVDGTVRCWNIPPPTIDPYDTYDASVMFNVLEGHKDAVWSLKYNSCRQQLISCSGDGTVKLWSPNSNTGGGVGGGKPGPGCLVTTLGESEEGVPTSCDWVTGEAGHLVVGWSTAACVIYDAETAVVVTRLDTSQDPVSGQTVGPVNSVLSHPTLPITITGHEDRHIRFYDNNTGALVHSMVAHLDSVTSLAVDQHGLYLISGSHDCSIRLWNLESKTCVQEITAHRKKFDESIFDVAFHPSRPYIASAGADALAKVFI